IYLIQVRAKESMEGAQRILEYLSANFGLGPAYIERDLRGDHNAEGKVLYTAFVGPYFRRVEADKECERLKKETRRTPYRNSEDSGAFGPLRGRKEALGQGSNRQRRMDPLGGGWVS